MPDIVVNNAGIGQAGAFLDTPAEQWDRVLDVNLGGVVNGCRSFGRRLVERGTGGHIVNVASMAAYAPLKSLNAYCTSKAAVYMFSDCLRAELDAAGIGLTTICPGVINTNIVLDDRVPRRRRASAPRSRAGARSWSEMFELRRYGPDKVANGDRVGGQEEQADAAGHPRGLPAVRHLAAGAAGDAQHRARQGCRLSRFVATMSSRTANIVRVGTPVPPLGV